MALIPLLISIWLALLAWRRRQIAIPHWKPLAWTALAGLVISIALLLIDLESQKLATRLLTPLGLIWLLLAGCVLAALRDRAWWRSGVLGGCWLLLTLGANAWLAAWLVGRLEAGIPPAPPAVRWDAACILGGGTGLTADDRPQLTAAGDRLRVGFELWRTQRVPLLVTSGQGMLGRDSERDLSAETTALWTTWGVPETAIVRVPGPVNTAQEVTALTRLAHERGWQRVAIVTSAWHLPRALALARSRGLAADGVRCDERSRIPPASPVYLVPSAHAAEDIQMLISEVLGRCVGR